MTLKRKVKNLEKDVEQLTDSNGHKIGSAAYTIKINPGAKDLVPNSDTVTLTDNLTVQQGYTAELDLALFSCMMPQTLPLATPCPATNTPSIIPAMWMQPASTPTPWSLLFPTSAHWC